MSNSSPDQPRSSLFLRLPGGGFEHERAIWRHRDLLRQLVKADLRGRYVATSMGFFWSVIHPLLSILVYIFVFSTIFAAKWESLGISFDGNFAIYFCSGMLPWLWFSEAMTNGTMSIVNHGTLIRKNVFPMIVLPMQPILSGLIHFLIAFAIFLAFRFAFFGWPGWWVLALPGVILLQVWLTMGLVYIMATLNVFWRDVNQIMMSMLMIWLWLTPIFYLPIFFEGKMTDWFGDSGVTVMHWMFWLNPLYHLVGLYQSILFYTATPDYHPTPWVSVVVLTVLCAVLWFIARRLFGRAQSRMVEMV